MDTNSIMALVSGQRSTLNPNAPPFIPVSVRQVEDFSPEWWDLVTTATWFRDYWVGQHQEEDVFGEEEQSFNENNVIGLLPDTIDLDVDEDILNMEAQLEEFLQSSDSDLGMMGKGFDKNADAILKMAKEKTPMSSWETTKHLVPKPAKYIALKNSPRVIHQPR